MMQSNFLEGDHGAAFGMGQGGSETFRSVDLAVRPLADLFESAVVSDGAGGEGVAMDGIMGDGGGGCLEVE